MAWRTHCLAHTLPGVHIAWRTQLCTLADPAPAAHPAHPHRPATSTEGGVPHQAHRGHGQRHRGGLRAAHGATGAAAGGLLLGSGVEGLQRAAALLGVCPSGGGWGCVTCSRTCHHSTRRLPAMSAAASSSCTPAVAPCILIYSAGSTLRAPLRLYAPPAACPSRKAQRAYGQLVRLPPPLLPRRPLRLSCVRSCAQQGSP
jgi:hypothetical protein